MPAEEPRRKEASEWAMEKARWLPIGGWTKDDSDERLRLVALALDAARAEGMEEAAKMADAEAVLNQSGVDLPSATERSRTIYTNRACVARQLATAIRAAKGV